MARGLRATTFLGVLMALLLAGVGRAGEPESPEWVKASFLFHLTRYVTWPAAAFASPDAPIVLVVVGNGPLAEVARSVTAGKQVEGHPIEVRSVAAGEPLPRAHLVLLQTGDYQALKDQTAALRDGPTLRVAESERYAEAIGDVGFTLVKGRVSFDINRNNARRHGLKVSSKLMNLASNVE